MARYEIIIKNESNETDQEAYAEKLPTNEDMGGGKTEDTATSQNKRRGSPMSSVRKGIRGFKTFASSTIMLGVAKQIFDYNINRVGLETGNQHKQDVINFHMSAVTSALSVAGGFLLGGPVVGIGAKYKGSSSTRFKQFKTYEGMNKAVGTMQYNQGSGTVESSAYGENMRGAIARI